MSVSENYVVNYGPRTLPHISFCMTADSEGVCIEFHRVFELRGTRKPSR